MAGYAGAPPKPFDPRYAPARTCTIIVQYHVLYNILY